MAEHVVDGVPSNGKQVIQFEIRDSSFANRLLALPRLAVH
jgi:hypothetical protein